MRSLPWSHIEKYRVAGDPATGDGAFRLQFRKTGGWLRIIANRADSGWEHVSVSLIYRTPTWEEMEFVCRLFWFENECVMQLHPPRSMWVNNHPYCLHLWRPTEAVIPLPPKDFV